MSFRDEHGKLRNASMRLKDVPKAKGTARDRSANHDAHGRFTLANSAARGRATKTWVKRSLGTLVGDAELDGIVKAILAMFAEELKAMPADSVAVRTELAAAARRSVIASVFHLESTKVGISSDRGIRLQELAMRHDQAASRHRVAALGFASRAGDTMTPEERARAEEAARPVVEIHYADGPPAPAVDDGRDDRTDGIGHRPKRQDQEDTTR